MRAIVVTEGGGPDVLVPGVAPMPQRGSGEVLVRVAAAGVNFLDVYMRRAAEARIPGMEGAGVVEQIDEVGRRAGLAVGDRVAWIMHPGSYAAFASVPVARLVPVPDDVELVTAAAAMLQGLTAGYLAGDSYPIRAGDVALVHSAAGGVGRLLSQLAVAAGARVLATVSSDEKARIVRAVGASDVIRYDEVDFAATARVLTRGRGVDVVYDAVNRRTFHDSLRALRARGTMVLYGEASGQVDPLPPKALQAAGSVKLTYPSLAHFVADRDELLARSARLFAAVADGTLQLAITRYPLEDASAAHDDLEGRRSVGKLVLEP